MAGGSAASGAAGNAVRIVVAGDAKTGKSSLIVTAAAENFPSNVPPVLPPTRLPEDLYPDRVPVTIIDTSSSTENRGKLVEELMRADAVVLTYACDRPDTLDKLSNYWLPELRQLEVRVPVIVVGCMLDKRGDQQAVSLEQVMSPIMQQFREIETCIECSALNHIQIPEVFYYAQKAVLHPTAPLFDQEQQVLKPRCVRALKRIFILCDNDRDGALSDAELNDFQVKCFNDPLQPSEIVGVKRVVQEKLREGVDDRGLTLTGFLFLHALFIEKGRLETTWTVLRKFGYNNEIRLRDDQLPPPVKRYPDQSVELTSEALEFLRKIFITYDVDCNTWTVAHDWGAEERCPSPDPKKNKKVDELDQCNAFLGKEINQTAKVDRRGYGKPRKYFPFKQNELFVATLRVGSEGIQMTVDGKHVTSFSFRETLEPWLVSELRISGDINLISVVASGLPTSEDSDHIPDLETLKAVPLTPKKQLDLFIGIFSTANNFKRRMGVRRSWMQYPEVRSGQVAIRFFVGLHKNQMVNEELWNEARTYQDIQLMPFVDYYSLIAWKTIAICIFGTEVVSSKFIMKTDDDAFVRVDEILNSLKRANVTRGLLYGLINSDAKPQRGTDSKWYISPEEWSNDTYPPFAHGPGYVVSSDIARTVANKHRKGQLKIFKLEDVIMGVWIDDMKKNGLEVKYENDERIANLGCVPGYVVAHYQSPRDMLCLWQNIQDKKLGLCCGD